MHFFDSKEERGEQIGMSLGGRAGALDCISFRPDVRQAVVGSEDGTLRLWGTEVLGAMGNPSKDHELWLSCVSFSYDGQRNISGGHDGIARALFARSRCVFYFFYEVDSSRWQIIGRLIGHQNLVTSVAASSDGRFAVSRDRNAETIVWDLHRLEIVWRSDDRHKDPHNLRALGEIYNIFIQLWGRELCRQLHGIGARILFAQSWLVVTVIRIYVQLAPLGKHPSSVFGGGVLRKIAQRP